jgi:hypothetical protein
VEEVGRRLARLIADRLGQAVAIAGPDAVAGHLEPLAALVRDEGFLDCPLDAAAVLRLRELGREATVHMRMPSTISHLVFQRILIECCLIALADRPARKHGLWEETCFEFFLGVKGYPRYWEFTLSPAGHWNVYGFAGYRQGMAEESAITSLPVSVRRRRDSLLVAVEPAVDGIVTADRPLSVGIAAVLQLAGGGLTYWALIHPGPQADFHRRDSFLVER